MESRSAAGVPFRNGEECLEAWFLALEPAPGPSPEHPSGVLPIEARLPLLQRLAARTSATRDAGIAVPVFDAIEALGLDLLDRLLLLALLRDSVDVRSNGGARLGSLCAAAGAASWAHRSAVRRRLEEAGALRQHGLVESDGDPAVAERLYRLAPRWTEPLLAGRTSAPPESFELAATPAERLQWAFAWAVNLLGCIAPDPEERRSVWSYPVPDGPGWDAAARCRRGLFEMTRAFLETDGPASSDPIGRLLREAGVTGVEEAALLVLLLANGVDAAPLSWAVLACALHGAQGAGAPLPDAATSPLVAARLVEVAPSGGSSILATLRASADARSRTVPPGLPALRASRVALPDASLDGVGAFAEKIEPRLSLDRVVLPRAARARLAEALAVPAALASLSGSGWGVEEGLLGSSGVALLFHGPPGTGKTLCAEAIAGQLGRRLWRLRAERLLSRYVGETEKRLVEVFAAARAKGDVVLIDEADSFLTTREAARRTWEVTLTNVLLQEIERFAGVVVLTTNRDGALDPALERRLLARIAFALPGAAEREELWESHLPARVPRAPDVDLRAVATAWPLSGSAIRTAALFAIARAAARQGAERRLTRADLDEAAAAQAARSAQGRPSIGFSPVPLRPPRLALVARIPGPERKENP